MSYIGNQPTNTAFLVDTFSGTGSQVNFTMSIAPANTTSMLVAVTGVVQDPSTYSVIGNTLTFSAAPPNATNNISVRYMGIPASGVTTTAYRTVTNFTATAGQTSFTVPSYTVGYINVYRNGVRLTSTDYTASTGTTVVLNNGCTLNDTVVTESFYVSSVSNAIPATPNAINSTYLSPNLALTTPTLTSPNINGTPTMGTSLITTGTAVASTSGTSIDFTGIPSWVKRITVMFTSVSTNGTSPILIQLGISSGVTISGYLGSGASVSSTGTSSSTSTTGFKLNGGTTGAAEVINGFISVALLASSTNTWAASGSVGRSDSGQMYFAAGSVALSGTLDRVRITTVAGTDTFDAGSINILYE